MSDQSLFASFIGVIVRGTELCVGEFLATWMTQGWSVGLFRAIEWPR